MKNQEKTKDELQNELVELQKAYNEVKQSFDQGNVFNKNGIKEIDLSKLRFREALDNLMEGLMIIAFDWTYLYVNKAAAHQAFQEPENLIGRTFMEMFPEIENTEIFTMYRRCMRERTSLKFESSYSFENGIVKWFGLNIVPVREGMLVLSLDITERKRAEDELRIKEERYRLLTDHARDVVWTQKLDGTITYISPAVEQLRGLTVEEAMHQSPEKILTADSLAISVGYLQKLISAFESGLPLESFRGELEYYRKDGSILYTEVIVYPLSGDDLSSVTVLGVTRDITERKQFEAQLLNQTNNLKELNATKDKFFSIIAHDLKDPFNVILGFSEMLKNEARNLDIDLIVEYSGIINTSARQTFRLLENLLDWAKMQQDHIQFEPTTFLFNTLIKNEIENLKHNADQKDITLVNHTNQDIFITADEKMLSTVLRNLISNAIKFTFKNGEVDIEAKIKNKQVNVSVADTGIGMKKEIIEKLFKIENSFTTRGTENEKGSGLGLLLCKEFVEKNGGIIWVESESGKGSKFQFSIPSKDFDAKCLQSN